MVRLLGRAGGTRPRPSGMLERVDDTDPDCLEPTTFISYLKSIGASPAGTDQIWGVQLYTCERARGRNSLEFQGHSDTNRVLGGGQWMVFEGG